MEIRYIKAEDSFRFIWKLTKLDKIEKKITIHHFRDTWVK